MHDCPQCQVPLHGHESFCPVCGLKQRVRPEFQGQNAQQYDKPFNPLGLILAVLVLGGVLFYALQGSWVGQLARRGPEAPAGDSALAPPAAREKLENAVLQNLAGQSKTCKFVYMSGEKTVDRNSPQPVELTIDVNLKDPKIRKSIVEPVKSLMVPAQINTLTLNDSHSHATITYSVAIGASDSADDTADQNTSTSDSTNTQ
jgi:hypothetical protein